MPSPFPGVDPYLENRLHWRGFHELFISVMTAALNATLPEGFVANIDERLYVIFQEEERESYIEILQLGGDAGGMTEHVIAVIEVISRPNKSSSQGREEYRRKQQAALRSRANLLEIDLLRQGSPAVAVPTNAIVQAERTAVAWDYLICLHHGATPGRFHVWPRTLPQPLPQIMLPLVENVPDVPIDLQAAYDQAYDAGPYRRRVDYRNAPSLALDAANAAWADALLREKSLR